MVLMCVREVTRYFYKSNPSALANKRGKFRVDERKKRGRGREVKNDGGLTQKKGVKYDT
jgi:hypothetical protein